MSDEWIWICRWEDFQHYAAERDRGPAWIKQYTKQLDDDRYTDLPPRARSLLHDLRMAFARCSYRVRISGGPRAHRERTVSGTLSQRVMQRVYTSDLELLNRAGFIEFISREVLEKRLDQLYASRAPAHSRRQQQKKTAEKPEPPKPSSPNVNDATPGEEPSTSAAAENLEAPRESEVEAAGQTLRGWDHGSFAVVMPLAAELTQARFLEIVDEVKSRKRIKNQPGLLVNKLQIAVHEQRIANIAYAVADIPLSPTEQARRDPDHYIPAMAPHLDERDLARYLHDYVKDKARHDELRGLWLEHRGARVSV